MVSLWKSSQDGDQENTQGEDQQQQRPASSGHSQTGTQSEDATERTRLLPRQQPVGGYLDPNDPAVSAPSSACVLL